MTLLEAEILAILVAVGVNLPFGAYRVTTRRYSWRWFVAIHLPIPFVVIMRVSLGLGWWFMPFMLAATVAGQLLGSWLFAIWRARHTGAQTEPAD
jgi:hypothetical protein